MEINSETLRVELAAEAGGRIRQIIFAGCELLVPSAGRSILEWGMYPMAPWPGRIARGEFSWRGGSYQVDPNLGLDAIHGTVFDQPFDVVDSDSSRCNLRADLDERWPWAGSVEHRIEVDGSALTTRLQLESTAETFPGGLGWHPWFVREGDPAIYLDATGAYPARDLIPTGPPQPIEGELRLEGPLDDRRIDDVFVIAESPIVIEWAEVKLTISTSSNMMHVCVYTPPDAFCVEPMTCAADAFNLEARGIHAGAATVDAAEPLVAEAVWHFEGC